MLQLPISNRHIFKHFTTIVYDDHLQQSDLHTRIDYQSFENSAHVYKPRLITVSPKYFSRSVNLGIINAISRRVGAYTLVDITESAGLIVAGLMTSPFEYADIVISRTQGPLRGPFAALIFSRKSVSIQSPDRKTTAKIDNTRGDEQQSTLDLAKAIDGSVFPRHQGGPHNHAIMATAVALAQCRTGTFRAYQKLAVSNAAAMCERLQSLGYAVQSSIGTPSYDVLIKIDGISPESLTLAKDVFDEVRIAVSLSVTGTSRDADGGLVRLLLLLHLGSYAMTSRGLSPPDFLHVADFVARALAIVKRMNHRTDPSNSNSNSSSSSGSSGKAWSSEVEDLRREVEQWTRKFPTPWE